MTRKLKTLGLMLLALLAIGAVSAAAASAAQWHSNTGSGTTHITGTQIGTTEFVLANKTVFKCTFAVMDATYSGTTASDLTLTTTKSGCTAFGQKAEIKTNGCVDTLLEPTEIAPLDQDHYDAIKLLVCGAGKKVELVVPTAGCTVSIAAQTAGGVVDLTNITSPEANKDDVVFTSTATTKYTTEGGGICGAAGTGASTGSFTLKAYNNVAHTEQRDLAIN
jgi:hypothetical protein